jgi:hypothetical protein
MKAAFDTVKHAVDPGGSISLPVRDVVANTSDTTSSGRKLRLETHSCGAPECKCLDTEIQVFDDSAGVSAIVMFDPSTRQTTIARDSSGLFTEPIATWFQAELAGPTGDFLAARARRVKLRDQPRPWRLRDWSSQVRGDLVSYCDAIPGDFDLVAQLDNDLYWARDLYCVNPHCDCRQVAIEFHNCGDDAPLRHGESLGVLRVELTTGQIIEADQTVAKQAFESLRRTYSIDELRYRYGRMREMARDVGPRFGRAPNAPIVVSAAPQRNQLCACGSGKKYKKCCGAPAAAGDALREG